MSNYGNSNSDGRVSIRMDDTGSIYDHADANTSTDLNQKVGNSGLTLREYSELHSQGSGGNAVRASSGGPVNIGGFSATTPSGEAQGRHHGREGSPRGRVPRQG